MCYKHTSGLCHYIFAFCKTKNFGGWLKTDCRKEFMSIALNKHYSS